MPSRRPSAGAPPSAARSRSAPLNVLFVASEAEPFAKTGGLGDVLGALPKALSELGHDVRVMLPRYRSVRPERFGLRRVIEAFPVTVGAKTVPVAIDETTLPKSRVIVYFVDQPGCFDRDGLYQANGRDFPDNLERFSLLCEALLRAVPKLGWRPDLVHCHDWQTALLIPRLAADPRLEACWRGVGRVFTVHNLAYQGLFPETSWPSTNLPRQLFGVQGLEFYGQINCLKGALLFAQAITTVSPTYAKEIQTPAFGCGLDGVLVSRREALTGILNGIDADEWNPAADAHLPSRYSVGQLAGKSVCKLSLQRQLGLPEHHVLLVGMIQRLVEQKGIDLVMRSAEQLLALPLQLVVLGTGERAYHEALAQLAKRYPERLSVTLRFDEPLSHQIEAGCDALLMPSRFEPCGLNQMYSMRYGTVPIVRRIGGLADTVTDVTPQTLQAGRATGFVFEEYTTKALVDAVKRAVTAFGDHALWGQVVRAGMERDDSWARSAKEYVRVYEWVMAARPQ